MADTYGFSLADSIRAAEARGMTISLPHYFASAVEHGWDDVRISAHLREALIDLNRACDFERVWAGCVWLFMREAAPGRTAVEMGRRMREDLERVVGAKPDIIGSEKRVITP